MPPQLKESIRKALLTWYSRHQRDLPWRATHDPYHILVSEIMLQQTQVERVRQYYQKFLKKFPTLRKLAQAPLDEVLKAWEGLGYYARARHLHRAAQIVLRDYGGKLPQSRKELLKLPGIGRYTAGAIVSIAFGQDEPVVDANVRRVLSRLFAIRQAQTHRELEELARKLLPPGQAGLFNQALMDLGATICVVRQPKCLICPLAKLCEAQRLGIQSELPVRPHARAKPHYDVAVGIIWKGDKILITKRPDEGLLGGLWEFPGGKRQLNESLEDCVRREIFEEVNVRVRDLRHFMTVRHGYSHFTVTLHVFWGYYAGGRPRCRGCSAWAWVRPSDLPRYAFPSANQKIIARLFDALDKSAVNSRSRARNAKE
jgi:A/G-specific adenine glycosylase